MKLIGRKNLGLAAAIAVILCGCTVGPRYTSPQAPTVAAGPFQSAAPGVADDRPTPANWWRLFDDPVLDRLIEKALSANTDLKVAAANLAYAQALSEEARAGLFPSTDLTAAATYGKSATANLAAALGGPPAKTQWSFGAGFSAAYEVDLFGRVRSAIRSANANAQAVADAENVVRITVAAETAAAYANACAYGEQAAVARRSLSVAQQTYDILVRERTVGAVSDLDVERQATVLEQVRAQVPTLDGQRRSSLFELAALTGEPPANAPADVASCVTPPKVDHVLPAGDGTAMLRRRPDVAEAERQLASAMAKINVATAEFYPTITLAGSVNSAASTIGGLGSAQALSFGVGPMLSWSIPNVAVARAHVHEASAQASAALASFDSTVLQALKETEQALATYGGELDHHAALAAASGHAAEAFRLAQTQYQAGSISFLDLLQAETTTVSADQALAVSDQQLAGDQISVFEALGGGWEGAPAVVPPSVR